MANVLTKIFGSRNERLLKQYSRTVARINALEPEISKLDDAALRAKTDEFRLRIADKVAAAAQDAKTEVETAAVEELLPEAFAVVREAGKRTLRMRHFDVQLLGGMVLHYGKISEMRTGEGKTLVATLPAYLNALAGNGVHIVTVNDYLAHRDAEWMGRLYGFLGLTVGVNVPEMDPEDKRKALVADLQSSDASLRSARGLPAGRPSGIGVASIGPLDVREGRLLEPPNFHRIADADAEEWPGHLAVIRPVCIGGTVGADVPAFRCAGYQVAALIARGQPKEEIVQGIILPDANRQPKPRIVTSRKRNKATTKRSLGFKSLNNGMRSISDGGAAAYCCSCTARLCWRRSSNPIQSSFRYIPRYLTLEYRAQC